MNNLNCNLDTNKTIHHAWEFIFFTEKNTSSNKKVKTEIKWHKPPKNMIKLNRDGAFSSNNNATGLGGTFRNSNGDWIIGFHKAIQALSATHAKLMALPEALKIEKESNFINLEIETDSMAIIKLMYEDCNNFSNIVS
ncbi:uncharacterized protein LOC142176528 [Nicotiana tabacum]|uniref:Uncharacterized protein LOC142176528 n=1 Tax=Nicotiana tabacum TaxID=4097 RepID=A0AC58TTN8_TOBAC